MKLRTRVQIWSIKLFRRRPFQTYADYRDSDTWKELRRKARQRDGHRCRVCNRTEQLSVHHRRYPELYGTETVDDLTTLCQPCHDAITRLPWAPRRDIADVSYQSHRNPAEIRSFIRTFLLGFISFFAVALAYRAIHRPALTGPQNRAVMQKVEASTDSATKRDLRGRTQQQSGRTVKQ